MIEFELSKVSSIDPGKLVSLIQLSGDPVKLVSLIQLRGVMVSLYPKRINYIRMRSCSVSLKDKAIFILEQLRRLK